MFWLLSTCSDPAIFLSKISQRPHEAGQERHKRLSFVAVVAVPDSALVSAEWQKDEERPSRARSVLPVMERGTERERCSFQSERPGTGPPVAGGGHRPHGARPGPGDGRGSRLRPGGRRPESLPGSRPFHGPTRSPRAGPSSLRLPSLSSESSDDHDSSSPARRRRARAAQEIRSDSD